MYSRVTSPAAWEEARKRRLYCPSSKGKPSEGGRDIPEIKEPDRKSPLYVKGK